MDRMIQQPMVSIIIPVYNGSNYLKEAIESALAQTYANIEIIVVNDGSTDEGKTEQIALSYGEKIRYLIKSNGGSSSALNYGIKHMKGEWFSWLSHDDLYYENKVKYEIEAISELAEENREDRHLVFSAFDLINESGRYIRKANIEQEKRKSEQLKFYDEIGRIVAVQMSEYSFHGCSCLINKKAIEEVGYFNESLKYVNDVDMWFRLIVSGFQIHYIPTPLVIGRVHKKQISREIGFSYHNVEQDLIWGRSYDWLKKKGNADDLILFAKCAFQKSRFSDGKKAIVFCGQRNPKRKFELYALAIVWRVGYEVLYRLKKIAFWLIMR